MAVDLKATPSQGWKPFDTTGANLRKSTSSDLGRSGSDRAYLMVFSEHSSRLYELPQSGEVLIGRDEGAHLHFNQASVSRKHARIVMAEGIVTLIDLGSQNGTFLNGQRVEGPRPLSTADVVRVGEVTLVFHASQRPAPGRAFFEADAFRRRAEEEMERAIRYERPLTIFAVALGVDRPNRASVHALLAGQLRLMDVLGWGPPDQLLGLMPETTGEAAQPVVLRLLKTLEPLAPAARAGVATCPQDGCDVETLLVGARVAIADAPEGETVPAQRAFKRLTVGNASVVVADPGMQRLYALIERLAPTDLPILVCGETGSGKELAASAVHHWSNRKDQKLVPLNCAALQENLVESELFGYDRGAFSGAVGIKEGLFEVANQGTVFLDEIGELSASAQAKLLRVLETKRVQRIGDLREREVDIRIVAATNRNLDEDVKAGRFRRDLFFRLSGGLIWLPPLRDRSRELPVLALSFLAAACEQVKRPTMTISNQGMKLLSTYEWPGNVRELKNLMEYFAAAMPETVIRRTHVATRLGIPDEGPPEPKRDLTQPITPPGGLKRLFKPLDEEIRDLERTRMREALEATGGNQVQAADLLGMPHRTFRAKVKEYDLPRRTDRRSS